MSQCATCNGPAPVHCSLESNAVVRSSSALGSGTGSRWFLITIVVLACSACASVPKEVLDTAERAHQNFDAGNLEAALNDYQAVQKDAEEYGLEDRGQIEVRIGECQLRLGRPDEARQHFEHIDRLIDDEELEISAELQLGKELAHAEAYCELGRRTEPIGLGTSKVAAFENTEQRQRALAFYERSRDYYDRARSIDSQNSEATLGLAYAFMQIGILARNTSALMQARSYMVQLRGQAPADDPRYPFYQGKLTQILNEGGTLTDVALGDFRTATKRDRHQRTFSYHELYRHLYRQVLPYPTPEQLGQLDADSRRRIELIYTILGDYLQFGREPEPAWAAWVTLREELGRHYGGYRDWISKDRHKDVLIAEAGALVRGQTAAVGLEAYRLAMDRLNDVDTRFHEGEQYRETRREVQGPYIERLISHSEVLVGIDQYRLARKAIKRALALCDRRFVDEHARVLSQCNEQRNKVNIEEKWAAIAAQAREIARTDQQKALEYLTRSMKPEIRAVVSSEAFAQLQDEISNADVIFVKSLIERGRKLEADKPSEALARYDEAMQRVLSAKLTDLEDEVVRCIARTHFLLDDYPRCLEQLGDRENDPRDRILKGLCWYKRSEYAMARKMFVSEDITFDLLRNTVGGPSNIKIAGLAYLHAGDARGARRFLEKASEQDRSEELSEARAKCYRQILDGGDLEPSEERRILEQLVELPDVKPEEQRRLAVILYRDGVEEQQRDLALFRQSYEHMTRSLPGDNLTVLSDEERRLYSRLVACFADYVPMKQGTFWEYKTPNGVLRYHVTSGSGDRFVVSLDDGDQTTSQDWTKLPNSRELERRERGTFERLPVGLKSPEQEPADRSVPYRSKRKFIARLVDVGLSVPAGGHRYDNCIQIRVSEDGKTDHVDYYFAPGIGQIKYVNSVTGDEWELINCSAFGAS